MLIKIPIHKDDDDIEFILIGTDKIHQNSSFAIVTDGHHGHNGFKKEIIDYIKNGKKDECIEFIYEPNQLSTIIDAIDKYHNDSIPCWHVINNELYTTNKFIKIEINDSKLILKNL